jgi:quinol monooxygenase YgiN
MNPLYLIAEIYPHPEKLDEAREIFEGLIQKTLQEPGCLLYDLVIEDGADHWLMLEKWESKAAWDAHMETEHVKQNQIDTPKISRKATNLRFLNSVSEPVAG